MDKQPVLPESTKDNLRLVVRKLVQYARFGSYARKMSYRQRWHGSALE